MMLHCDSCQRELGGYLYGKGGIEEIAHIFGRSNISLPDVICNQCWDEGYSLTNRKFNEPEKYLAPQKEEV
jgi:hypothetical protein